MAIARNMSSGSGRSNSAWTSVRVQSWRTCIFASVEGVIRDSFWSSNGPSQIAVQQVLVIFLPPRLRLRVDLLFRDARCDRLERRAFHQHRLGLGLVPAGAPLRAQRFELAVLDQVRGCDQRGGANVDAADVAEQEIGLIDRLTAHFGVEIEAARRQAARLQDEIKR